MTVCLLAPIGLDHDAWQWLWLDGHPTIAHDLPGFGGRARQPERATMSDWVDDVARAVEVAGTGPMDVIGCSLGGMVAMNLAIRAPELVRSLVLACTGASADTPSMLQRAAKVEEGGMHAVLDETLQRWFSPEALATVPELACVAYARDTLLALEPGAFADGWRVISGHDVIGQLGAIKVPTTCVAGQCDRAAPIERMQVIAEAIPGARLVTIPGPHMLFLEEAAIFGKVVTEHFESIPPVHAARRVDDRP